ncbi:unnamed protein product [Xylocopa violacea]|uniref:Uncharacterized protein n=1 Tax=Xylocopa violacea TaxID=135666 RepID=A0ABP1NP42_XYLVO
MPSGSPGILFFLRSNTTLLLATKESVRSVDLLDATNIVCIQSKVLTYGSCLRIVIICYNLIGGDPTLGGKDPSFSKPIVPVRRKNYSIGTYIVKESAFASFHLVSVLLLSRVTNTLGLHFARSLSPSQETSTKSMPDPATSLLVLPSRGMTNPTGPLSDKHINNMFMGVQSKYLLSKYINEIKRLRNVIPMRSFTKAAWSKQWFNYRF